MTLEKIPVWAVHMRYKSYNRVSRSTYMRKIQPLRLRPIEPIASESVLLQISSDRIEYQSLPLSNDQH